MASDIQICLIIIFSLYYSIFFFPMLHDLFHHLGHATFLLSSCQVQQVSITLGDGEMCPRTLADRNTELKICIKPGWFYKSLHRQSQIHWTFGLVDCSEAAMSVMGGIFGLLFSWFCFSLVVVFPALILRNKKSAKKLTGWELVGGTFGYLFVPYSWLRWANIKDYPVKLALGLGTMVIQWDLINDFYYSFFPSRRIYFRYEVNGDGTMAWLASGMSAKTVENISYVVWVLLMISYAVTIYFCFKYLYEENSDIKKKNKVQPSSQRQPNNKPSPKKMRS